MSKLTSSVRIHFYYMFWKCFGPLSVRNLLNPSTIFALCFRPPKMSWSLRECQFMYVHIISCPIHSWPWCFLLPNGHPQVEQRRCFSLEVSNIGVWFSVNSSCHRSGDPHSNMQRGKSWRMEWAKWDAVWNLKWLLMHKVVSRWSKMVID